MKDDVHIFSDVLAVMRIAHIAVQDFYLVFAINIFQPAPEIKGVVLGQSLDLVALFDEQLGEMGADEAVGTGDEYSLVQNDSFKSSSANFQSSGVSKSTECSIDITYASVSAVTKLPLRRNQLASAKYIAPLSA